MTRKWDRILTALFWAVTTGPAWAQTTQFATLDIEWENVIIYADNLADRSKLATAPNAVNVNLRNFMPLITIGDIVSVNGRPTRGSWVAQGPVHHARAQPDAGPGDRRPWSRNNDRCTARDSPD